MKVEEIQTKLNRIKGQINGIEKMIAEQRDSIEIVQQVSAVRAALSSMAVELLKDDCKDCLNNTEKDVKIKKFEELVTNFLKIT